MYGKRTVTATGGQSLLVGIGLLIGTAAIMTLFLDGTRASKTRSRTRTRRGFSDSHLTGERGSIET